MQITNKCAGCMACYSVCPVNAIQIIQNEEGFYVPEIDLNKCINCHRCSLTCPQNQDKNIKNPASDYCFAVQASKEECKKSSSGGVFPLLADYILRQGGYVCGAAFSEDFKIVKHIIIDKKSDLQKLRSSKYVQSIIGNVFKEIKILLENNKVVLFSGTPCQVAGLKSFLQKDYERLFTIDLLCHGAPSSLVWKKYVTKIAKGKNIKSVNFRDKNLGWKPTLSIKFDDGVFFSECNSDNLYFQTFLQNLILNEACYYCKYTDTTRTADITLGDFWGIENIDKSFENIHQGVSLVLINNSKGSNLFNKINFSISKRYPIAYAVKCNPMLETKVLKHSNRKSFFDNLQEKPILDNMKKMLEKKYHGIIANFWWTYNNYGALLSAYAVQQFLFFQGFDYSLLNFLPDGKVPEFSLSFVQEHLKLTHRIFTIEQLQELNNCTNNFVVGTDQVFRYKFIGKTLFPIYTLAFTNMNKRRFAFSASFGTDTFDEASFLEKYIFKKCLQRFDAISVREKSGVKLCKKTFGLDIEDILEPVLLIDKSYWDSLADSVNVKTQDKIVSYILDEDDEILKTYTYLENKYGIKVEKLANSGVSPEVFLSSIKNAKYFITDSFHGACFALIFNKRVICLTNKERGNSRFDNLKQKFSVDALFYAGWKDIIDKEESLFKPFNYQYFLEVVEKERDKARKWLIRTFNSTKKISRSAPINELLIRYLLSIKQMKLPNLLKERIKEQTLLYRFSDVVRKNKKLKLVFWGASLFLEDFIIKYKIKNSNILGIIDKNEDRQGTTIGDYKVFPPEKLQELQPDMVICSIKNNHERVYPIIREYVEQNYPNIEFLPDVFE